MWRTSSASRKSLPSTMRLPGPRLMGLRGAAMELFIKLFGDLLVFVYHCFDRIVIHGYLSGLSRPEQVVYFFRHVVGAPVVSKELLSQRTADYQNWVEAFARNHDIAIEWAEKGVRAPTEALIEPLLQFVSEPIEGYDNIPGAGGKSTGDAAFSISNLPPETQRKAIPAICDRLERARSFDTMPLVSALLAAAFPKCSGAVGELN